MIEYFISTGCSFTEVPIPEIDGCRQVNLYDFKKYELSWPVHVTNHLNCISTYKGKGASGNGIISKTTIYEVEKALKLYQPEDILVGIMWSGAYRQEVYFENPSLQHYGIDPGYVVNQRNPASIGGNYNYYKVMPYWEDELSSTYYKYFYDEVGSYISTLENILRVQWYLKLHNVKYFMTQYFNQTFPPQKYSDHIDISYLYDMIDFDYWLDVESEHGWCERNKDRYPWDTKPYGFKHPNTLQHKGFAEEVIIPYLTEKGYI